MDFFNTLTLDMKLIIVGIAGCVILALFSGNKSAEKRYLVALVVLSVAGFYRFTHLPGETAVEARAAATPAPHFIKSEPKHVPLESTAAH